MKRMLLLAALAGLGGCSVVAADVDDLQKSELGDYQSLTLQLRSMGIHRNEVFEYRVINEKQGQDDSLLVRGVRTPLGDDDEDILLSGAIPRDKNTRIDFYADHNDTPGYQIEQESEVGVDHGWSIELKEEDPRPDGVLVTRDEFSGDWFLLFEHQFEFATLTELATGRDTLRIVFSNLDVVGGAPVTARLRFNDRVIATHRCLPDHPLVLQLVDGVTGELTLEVPDVVDTTVDPDSYTVDVYVDSNRNGQYDDPSAGGDMGWRLTGLTLDPDVGMTVEHDLSSNGSTVDIGP